MDLVMPSKYLSQRWCFLPEIYSKAFFLRVWQQKKKPCHGQSSFQIKEGMLTF